jgi:beta-glucosidase
MYNIFNLPNIKFPDNFIWGSGTSGHQIEGDNIYSNNWATEQIDGRPEKSGKACNHYELYKEDVVLIKDLGHQAYRMSIEWSRIEPEQGKYDEKAIAHYIDLLSLLKKNNIKVFLTLIHFTNPQWFSELGGFFKTENLKFFEKYLEFIVPKVADYVDNWNVINEFNLLLNRPDRPQELDYKFNILKAHVKGYHIIKCYSKSPVSSAHAFVHFEPKRKFDKLDNIMCNLLDYSCHEFFFHAIRTGELLYPMRDVEIIPEMKGAIDYWAINCYTRRMVDSRDKQLKGERFVHKNLRMIDMDFYMSEFYPEGILYSLQRLNDLPVIITENGTACNDDRYRIINLALTLSVIKDAIDSGVDMQGYLHWSLLDNYEWQSFIPRFGLVDVDFNTFKRTPKPSAWFFKDIIENNGFSQKILRKYLKELPKA